MIRKTNKKQAFLMSVLSLVLCVSMLMGTTFAWFTDTVTSANNIIKAGNLDIELWYQTADMSADAWEEVTATSNIFKDGALWEPGYTEVVKLKIVNKGTLALKYQLGINVAGEIPGTNVAGEEFKLSKYIEFGVTGDVAVTDRAAAIDAVSATARKISEGYSVENVKMLPATEQIITLVVFMPTTVGNEANYKTGTTAPTINLGLNLIATQLNADTEKDSFGSDYDKDAKYPVTGSATHVQDATSGAEGTQISANEETAITVPANAPSGNYTMTASNKTTETDENGNTTVAIDLELQKDGVKVTATNGVEYTVTIEIEKNQNVTAVTHKGVAVENYSYDPITGVVTFTTDSFSPFTVTYKPADEDSVFVPSNPGAAGKLDPEYKPGEGEPEVVVAVDENGKAYASLTDAVKSGASKIYCKEGADLGTITHLDVTNDLVIFGNGAFISGGERDLAIDTYAYLTTDITVTVYNLHGIAFWAQRNTNYTVNLNLYNCNDISRVYINGTSGVNNIALYNCTASKGNDVAYKNLVGDTAVYSNANGSITVDGCTFTNVGCPVNLNHKVAGEQTVTVRNSTFVDCSTEGTAAYYAPIRLYNSAEGANQTLTVAGNTFTYSEGKAPINKADVLLNAKHNGADATGTIKATVQVNASVVSGVNVDCHYTIANADEFASFAAEVNKGEEYYGNTYEGKTVLLTANIDFGGAEWTPIGNFGSTSKQFKGVFDGQGYTVSNFRITQKSPDRAGKNRSPEGFFGNVNGTIKNLTIKNAAVKVTNDGRFVGGIVGRLNGGLIENCNLVDSSVEGSAWQIGGIVGQVNAGTIRNCVVKNTTVTGIAGVGAIAGFQMDAKETTITNCAVKNCTIAQNGSYGDGYDDMFAAVLGCINSAGATVNINKCIVEKTTVKGVESSVLCGYIESGAKLTIDSASVIATNDELKAAIEAKVSKIYLQNGDYSVRFTNNTNFNVDDMTIVGLGDAVKLSVSSSEVYYGRVQGDNVTFENIVFVGSVGATGMATYNNCTVTGNMECASSNKAKTYVNNCTIELFHTSGDYSSGNAYVKDSNIAKAEYGGSAGLTIYFENCEIGELISWNVNTELTNCKVTTLDYSQMTSGKITVK